MRRLTHLVSRFVRALSPRPPKPADEAWAASVLAPSTLLLYRRLPNHDRRHAIRGARRVARSLGPAATDDVLAAALLHDVGKYDAALGPVGRALVTVVAAGAAPERVAGWAGAPGWRGRVSLYVRHGELGADQLRAAGAPPAAVAWAAEHHHPERFDRVPLPPATVAALDAADHA